VNHCLDQLGRPRDFVSDEDLDLFAKNAMFVTVFAYRPLSEEYSDVPNISSYRTFATQHISVVCPFPMIDYGDDNDFCTIDQFRVFTSVVSQVDETDLHLAWFVLIHAIGRFYETYKRCPGALNSNFRISKKEPHIVVGGFKNDLISKCVGEFDCEADIPLLKKIVLGLLAKWKVKDIVPDDCLHEVYVHSWIHFNFIKVER
jgi:hypothetical protein